MNEQTEEIVVFDLDGTLANIDHRKHLIDKDNPRPNWERFFKACIHDQPVEQVIEICNLLSEKYTIHLFSGRSEIVREETIEWLKKHEVKYNFLKMRPDRNFIPDEKLKRSWMEEYKKKGVYIRMVFDDRDKVVKMWREAGIVCFQVAEGNF